MEFKEVIENREFERVLSFNGVSDPEYEYLSFKERNNYDYPQYDLHNLTLPFDEFDFVMLNQTIEHLYDPITALKNIYKYLSPGAIFYANVPVNNVPHSTPYHFFTGVTAMGLGTMVALAGFDIIKIGQWGNKIYFKQMFDNLWSDYTYSSEPGKCDADCPLVTWIFAIK
jgi:SAM-dependent methyltransferase